MPTPHDPFLHPRRHTTHLGKHGESLARAYLETEGYHILETNTHAAGGEIDLIAEYQNEIVFVEVKTRRPGPFQNGAEAVTPAKARHLARAAQSWLLRHQRLNTPCRCDVIVVQEDASRTDGSVTWIKNAVPLGEYC